MHGMCDGFVINDNIYLWGFFFTLIITAYEHKVKQSISISQQHETNFCQHIEIEILIYFRATSNQPASYWF